MTRIIEHEVCSATSTKFASFTVKGSKRLFAMISKTHIAAWALREAKHM